jgi:hypothetical protein
MRLWFNPTRAAQAGICAGRTDSPDAGVKSKKPVTNMYF